MSLPTQNPLMSTNHRPFLNLDAYLRNPGYHESAWKVQ
jgi:hypothetical protein